MREADGGTGRHPVLLPRPRFADLGTEQVPARVAEERIDATLPAQGYELRLGRDGVRLTGADEAGLFYGRATLAQLAGREGTAPAGVVRDHPDIAVRGVMLDVSRDKVPTMATLLALVDRLASWKVNHLQLYMEHTFAYAGHPDIHRGASPFTPEEIRELDAFCAARHIELVPNQNCLGHMERWLRHDRYRPLALAPEGFVNPHGYFRSPMTLDPANPASLALVRELLGELLPLYTSRRVHVGLDETWELGPERLPELVDWMSTLRALPELADREMLVWSDMVIDDEALLARLPAGVTPCEWGYEREHPFAERAARLAAGGVPFWVSPGTSSWNSLVGRHTNAVENCRAAASAARDHGASGYLVTDWGDNGHLQQLPVSEPTLAYAAAVSWCLDANDDLDLVEALSAHAFDDPTGGLAAALLTLGDAYLDVRPTMSNISAAVRHLFFPQAPVGSGETAAMRAADVDALRSRLAEARSLLERARPGRADGARVVAEVAWSIDLVELLADDLLSRLAGDGTLASVPEATRRALSERLAPLVETYGDLWHGRNRPGGFADSVAWLENLRESYETGQPRAGWGGMIDPA